MPHAPVSSIASSTADPTSCRFFAWASAAMPCQSDRSVVSQSVCRAAVTVASPPGTTVVNALSPFQPSTSAPASTDTMSPGASTRSPGIPCTISSFTDTHSVWR
jgi:hypothetical protein